MYISKDRVTYKYTSNVYAVSTYKVINSYILNTGLDNNNNANST